MARNSGFLNRLLNVIGLVEDDGAEENTQSRRVQPEDARARYGSTSSTSYSRDRQGAASYGSAGKAAQYNAYQGSSRTASAQQQSTPSYSRSSGAYSAPSSFERAPRDDRAARSAARTQPDPEFDELDFDNYQPPQRASSRAPQQRQSAPQNVQSAPRSARDSRHHMIVYYLHTLDECRDVISDLLENKSVLLNLEDMDDRIIQRAIDTLGGAAFALNATLRRASDRTYIIAPTSVDIAYTNDDRR